VNLHDFTTRLRLARAAEHAAARDARRSATAARPAYRATAGPNGGQAGDAEKTIPPHTRAAGVAGAGQDGEAATTGDGGNRPGGQGGMGQARPLGRLAAELAGAWEADEAAGREAGKGLF
jgi:hypothetical protein